MRQCSKCGKMMSDNAKFCDACGTMYEAEDTAAELETTVLVDSGIYNNGSTSDSGQYQDQMYGYTQNYDYQQQYQNQQYFNQQLIEQQKMLNNVVQQQQYMSNKMINTQPYVYVPTPVRGEAILKNVLALVTGVICFISIFLPFIGDVSIVTISDSISFLNYDDYYYDLDGRLAFAMFMLRLLPWVTGALAIVLVVSAFSDLFAVVKMILEIVELIVFLSIFWVILDMADPDFSSVGDIMGEFQMGFWLMIIGYILSIVSNYTSITRNTALYAPRIVGGYGVSDNNSRSVAAMVQDGVSSITWICPYCGSQNRDSRCHTCGRTRY